MHARPQGTRFQRDAGVIEARVAENCGSSSTHRSVAVRGRDLDSPPEEFIVEWPIREEAHLFDRLSTMPEKIEYNETATSAA